MTSSTTSRLGKSPEEAVKAPCVVETAIGVNINLTGEQTVNGVAVVAGDRVFVKDQTIASENGIYNVATTAWTRAKDWNKANDVVSGTLIPSAQSGIVWMVEFPGTFVPGVTEFTAKVAIGVEAQAENIYYTGDGDTVTVETAIKRRLSTVDTLAELKAFSTSAGKVVYRGVTYIFTSGDYSSEVSADGVGAFIESNDVAPTSGAWVADSDELTPRNFELYIDTASQQSAMQKMVNVCAAYGYTVNWGNGQDTYLTDGAVLIPKNACWRGAATIHNTRTIQDSDAAVFHPGNWNPAYFDDVTRYTLNTVSEGSRDLTFSTSGDSANFSAGDIVWVVSGDNYTGLTGTYPIYSQLVRLTEVGIGTAKTDAAITAGLSTAAILHADTSEVQGILGNDLYIASDLDIDTGLHLVSDQLAPFSRGGVLDSRIRIKSFDAPNGIFLNGVCRSKIEFTEGKVSRKCFDIAGSSHDSEVVGTSLTYQVQTSPTNISQCVMGEASRNVKVSIHSVNLDGYNQGSSVVLFANAKNCKFNFDVFFARQAITNLVEFRTPTEPTHTQFSTDGNTFSCDFTRVGAINRLGYCQPVAGAQYMNRNTFDFGRVTGGTYGVDAFAIDGTDTEITRRTWVQDGGADIAATAVRPVIRGYLPLGVSGTTDQADIMIRTDASHLAKVGNTRQSVVSVTATAAGTSNLSVTFPANSLEINDRWRIVMTGKKTGTAGDFSIKFGDTSFQFTANTLAAVQGEFTATIDVIVQTSTRYTMFGALSFDSAADYTQVVNGATSLASAQTFSLEMWKGDAADTVLVHNIDSEIKKQYVFND